MTISRQEQLKLLGQMQNDDIDYTDIEQTDAEFWQDATVNLSEKIPVTINLDPTVLDWYERQVPQDYHKLINHVLKTYMLKNQSSL
ncbi:MAG: hypothetical protein RLZZ490_2663 [Cyanobacteriota bacterium]